MKKKKSKKKIIIFIVIICLLLVLIISKKFSNNDIQNDKIEIETIEKRNIATSISATGTVETTTSKDVVSTLAGFKIEKINVKEGQKVNVGDIICTLDTSTLKNNLAAAEKSLSLSSSQSNIGSQSAQRGLDDAIKNKDMQVATTQSAIDQSKKAYDEATKKLDEINKQIKNLEKQVSGQSSNLQNITAEYKKNEQKYQTIQNEYEAQEVVVANAKIEYDQADESEKILKKAKLDEENNKLIQIQINLNTAKTEFLTAENNYKTISGVLAANQSLEELKISKQTLETQVANLKTAYDSAVSTHNATVRSADSAIATMQDQVASSAISSDLNSVSQNAQIDAYKTQISDGIIKSTVSGTVTAVNFKPGDVYTGTAIVTINGCEEFIVESEIDEYDIPDVKEGMKVLVKTDATREDEIEGRIIFVSPSATVNALGAVASNNATYKVKIALTESNDRLRLGMNAKLSIITESRENVWTVPYNAIYENEDGTKYIKVVKENIADDEITEENIEELNVKTGLESTYYVEIISDKLKDGIKVVLPEVEEDNSIETLINLMGADAGL